MLFRVRTEYISGTDFALWLKRALHHDFLIKQFFPLIRPFLPNDHFGTSFVEFNSNANLAD